MGALGTFEQLAARPEYAFLLENKDLKQLSYLVLSGSHGYGTSIKNSDVDLRGFAVEGRKYLYGLDRFEQFEDRETDTVVYGLKKFVRLCMNANPNALELLGVREDCIVHMDKRGRLVRENVSMFLSQAIIHTFGNYATAQLRRLQNSLARDAYPQEVKNKHIADSLNRQIHHFNQIYQGFGKHAIELYPTADLNAESGILMDIHLEKYPLSDFCNIYSEMTNVVKSYAKLNHRNRKKDDVHLRKHAMHLIRILVTGMDALEGKGIVTFREKEQHLFMDIRNGVFDFEELLDMSEEYIKQFDYVARNTVLPESVDRVKIEELLYQLYEM